MTRRDATTQVLIAHFLPDIVSGAERAIADLVRAGGEDFRYTMLTPGEGRLSRHYRENGFAVWTRRVDTRRRRYPGLHTMQSLLFARDLRRRAIDVVVCNTFAAASRMGTACRRAEVPYAIYVREYVSLTRLHRAILAKADTVLAVSEDVRRELAGVIPANKLNVRTDFIDAREIADRAERHRQTGRRLLPFPPSHPVVGVVGRLTPFKQQDLFLRAVPQILREVPDARFVIVGAATDRERDYEKGLLDLSRRLGLTERVAFLGNRRDAVEIIAELSVLCAPSSREPLGRTILEAQIVGTPVVASNAGGIPEIVEDGLTGLLFPSTGEDSEMEFARRVVRLLRKPDLCASLVQQGRHAVLRGAGSPNRVRDLECTLRGLVENVRSHAHV